MIESLKKLVIALQDELKQYGEMLALLDEQQEMVMRRTVENLPESVAAVQRQSAALQAVRKQRVECQKEANGELHLSSAASMAELIAVSPADYRPLLQALVQENNELLVRVQQRARQNHLLLSRSLELMQRLINSLFSGNDSSVYTDRGSLHGTGPSKPSFYEAVV